MRHMSGYICAEFDQPVNMYRGIPAAGFVHDEARHDPSRGFVGGFYFALIALGLPLYASFMDPEGWGREYSSRIQAYGHVAMLCVLGEDMAMETNRVRLHETEKDQYGLPIPRLHLDDHPNDFALKNYGIKVLCQVYEAAGAQRVFEGPTLPSSHNLGTCRMSTNPRDGVVNEWGRSHDVKNLFVVDGSQFVSSGASNPTLTIVALAIRQADYIAESMRGNEI